MNSSEVRRAQPFSHTVLEISLFVMSQRARDDQVSDHAASWVVVVPLSESAFFLSPSKHVEGPSKHQHK